MSKRNGKIGTPSPNTNAASVLPGGESLFNTTTNTDIQAGKAMGSAESYPEEADRLSRLNIQLVAKLATSDAKLAAANEDLARQAVELHRVKLESARMEYRALKAEQRALRNAYALKCEWVRRRYQSLMNSPPPTAAN